MLVYAIDPSVEFSYFLCAGVHFRGRKMIVPLYFVILSRIKTPQNLYKMYKCQMKIPFSEGFVRSIFCQRVLDN